MKSNKLKNEIKETNINKNKKCKFCKNELEYSGTQFFDKYIIKYYVCECGKTKKEILVNK